MAAPPPPPAGGAALPWAAQAPSASRGTKGGPSESLATVQTNDLEAVSIDQLGFHTGDRVEVKWHIETDGDEGSRTRWWGASIAGVAPAPPPAVDQAAAGGGGGGGRQRPVYQLQYDAAEGFEEEVGEVLLLNEHELYDTASRSVMLWRREGDAGFDPPDDEEEEAEGEAGDAGMADGDEAEGGTVSVAQLAELMDRAPPPASVGGGSSGGPSSALEALAEGAGDPAQLATMEAGFRDFMAHFRAYADAKASCGEGEVVITAADVREFATMMRMQQQSARQHRR